MHIDLEQLIKRYKELEKIIENEEYISEEEKSRLLLDAYNTMDLIMLISPKYKRMNKNEKKQIYEDAVVLIYNTIKDSEFINRSINLFLEDNNRKMITRIGTNISNKVILFGSYKNRLKIKVPEYLELVEDFAKKLPFAYFDVYKKLKDNNIELDSKRLYKNFFGFCYCSHYDSEAYVYSSFKNNRCITTLPHELMHVYDVSVIGNELMYKYSAFRECMPTFIEFLFCDYLKDNGYLKEASFKRADELDGTKVYGENITNIYEKFENQYKDNDELACLLRRNKINILISDMFAYYIYDLYKNNYEKYCNFVDEYYKYLGKSDENIFYMVSEENLMNGFNYFLEYNNDEARSLKRIR